MIRQTAYIPVLAGLVACVPYEPRPLDKAAVLRDITAEFDAVTADGAPLSLAAARDWMLEHNPRVVAARGVWHEAQARAAVATPLANPSMSVGPVFLSSGSGWGLDAALGWLVPLTGTRALLDDRNAMRAWRAEVATLAVARLEYLDLRAELLALASTADRVRIEQELVAAAQQLVDTQRRLGADATISALELLVLEMELQTRRSELAASAAAVVQTRGGLAARCGVAPTRIGAVPAESLPALPGEIPPMPGLRALLVEHSDLVELEAGFAAAEVDLRLAVQRQYPDLQIGGELEREGGANRLALPLGITVPLFDRNAGEIAGALAAREALRAEYHAKVREKLNELHVARQMLDLQQRRFRDLNERFSRLEPNLRALIETAVQSGEMNAIEQATALRRLREARREQVAARADLFAAWARLEHSCGAPLLRFPGEPEPPARAAAPGDESGGDPRRDDPDRDDPDRDGDRPKDIR